LEALVEAAEREAGATPAKLSGDRAYSAPRIRAWLAERGVEAVIPLRKDEVARLDEPPAFDSDGYKRRNAVERLVGWLKEMRAVATRSDKLAESFLGMVQMAMIRVCLRRAVPSNTA
jgi:transposase